MITGTLPPLNELKWIEEFNKYKQTPQYLLLNADFTLQDFKSIFFWEWFHRFWARLIGVVFAIPFIIFLIQRRFEEKMIKPLIILFLLGALQGAVGWIMVASGLSGEESILDGRNVPFMSGHVGAVVAALWPAINAPNANCKTNTAIIAHVNLFSDLFTILFSSRTNNCNANQNV